jgi:hypothetical protein
MKVKDKKQVVRIEPTDKASQRTKNRIREHGSIFQVERHHLDGQTWLMRQLHEVHGRGRWLGWLPVNEFKVIEKVNR